MPAITPPAPYDDSPFRYGSRDGLWHPFRYQCQWSTPMILFFVVLLVLLWLLGMVTSTTLGGALHILLVIAFIFLLIRLIRGQPV
jgi:hypothetical protein